MKRIILSLIFIASVFAVSKFVFDPTHLYYEIWWLDIPMHIIGGFAVTLLSFSVLRHKGVQVSYWKLFFFYAAIAITWELYEYCHDLFYHKEWAGWLDTIKDLFDGALGTTIAFFLLKK